jgi:hypothetical protein
MSQAQRAAANRDAAAYATAARAVSSRLHAIFYLGAVRYLNEPLKSVAAGNQDNALVQLAEGMSFYMTIHPTVAMVDPEADAVLMAYYTAAPASLTIAQRDAALAGLNRAAEALLLAPSDIVTPAMLD